MLLANKAIKDVYEASQAPSATVITNEILESPTIQIKQKNKPSKIKHIKNTVKKYL
jgi:hypothetical protein